MMTHAKSPVRPILLALFCGLFVLLAGCGGGGGGSAVGSAVVDGGGTFATATVTGRVNLPDADKSGVLVTLSRTADGGQSLAVARMIAGDAPVDLALLSRPDLHPSRAQAEGIFSAVTDAGGAYSIPNVPLGTYVVEATKQGMPLAGMQANLQITGDTPQVTVEEIFLTPIGALQGTVAFNPAMTDRSGVLCFIEGTSLLAVTDESGAYRISSVPFNSDGSPRAYVVTFQRAGFAKTQSASVTLTTPGATVTVPLATMQVAVPVGGGIAISTAAGNVIGLERHFNAASLDFAVTVPTGTPAPIMMSWPVFSSGLAGAPEVSRAPQRAVAFGPFEPFATAKAVQFPAEGAFRMSVRFLMADGQTVIAELPETLVCDRSQPTGVVFAPWLNDQPDGGAPDKLYGNELMLRVVARDLLSGDVEVQVLVDAVVYHAYEPLDPTRYLAQPLVLPGTADATHSLQANFRDRAGNVSTTQFTIQKLLPSSFVVDSYRGFLPREPIPVANLVYNGRIVYADGAFEHEYPGSVTPLNGTIVDGLYTPPSSGNDTLTVRPLAGGLTLTATVPLAFDGVTGLDMRVVGDPYTTVGAPLGLASVFAPVARFASGREQPVSFADLTYTIPTVVGGGPVGMIGEGQSGAWEFTPYYAGVHTIIATYAAGGVSDSFSIHVSSAPAFQQVLVQGTPVDPGAPGPQTPGFAAISWTLDQPAQVTIFYGARSVPDAYALDAYEKVRVGFGFDASGTESLYDLSPGTTHYFRLVAKSLQGIETISDEYRFVNDYAQQAGPVTFSAPDTGFQVPGASLPRGIDTLLYTFKLQTGAGEAVLLEEIAVSATSPDSFNLTTLRELRLLHTSSGAVMGTFKSIGSVDGTVVLRFTVNRPFNPASAVHFSLRGIVNEAEGKRVQFNAHPSSKITGALSGSQVMINNTNAIGALLVVGTPPAFNPSFGGAAGATTVFGGTYSDAAANPPIAIHFASVAVDPITGAATIFPDASDVGRAFIAQTPTSDPLSVFGQVEIACDTTTSGWSFDQAHHTGTVFVVNSGGSPVPIHLVHTSGKKIVFDVQFTENTSFAEGVADRYIMGISGLAAGI